MTVQNAFRKNQQRNDLRASKSSRASAGRTIATARRSSRSKQRCQIRVKGCQIRATRLRQATAFSGRQDRPYSHLLEHTACAQYPCHKCCDFCNRSLCHHERSLASADQSFRFHFHGQSPQGSFAAWNEHPKYFDKPLRKGAK